MPERAALERRRMRCSFASGIIVALEILLSGCSQGNWEPKQRPAGVPPYAIWAGGPDGGSYVWCDIDAGRDVNGCTVWNDFTGSVAEKGEYRLPRKQRAATRSELQFRWADRGGWIGLKAGLVRDNDVLHARQRDQVQAAWRHRSRASPGPSGLLCAIGWLGISMITRDGALAAVALQQQVCVAGSVRDCRVARLYFTSPVDRLLFGLRFSPRGRPELHPGSDPPPVPLQRSAAAADRDGIQLGQSCGAVWCCRLGGCSKTNRERRP
jgi:hypothetical protein